VCDPRTWKVLNILVKETKRNKLHIAFFNSTPQGGGGKFIKKKPWILRFKTVKTSSFSFNNLFS